MTEPKFIFVSFHAGTSGSFIAVLVNLFFDKDFYYKFSQYGAAHEGLWTCWKIGSEQHDRDISSIDNIHLHVLNLDYPYVVKTHCADIQYMKSKYTDTKIIHISFSDNEMELEKIFYNFFIKSWFSETPTIWKKDYHNEKLPNELSSVEIEPIKLFSFLGLRKSLHTKRFNLPNVLDIPFSKINLGDYSILEDLSSFLSMPINPSVIHAFEEYCKLQPTFADFVNRRYNNKQL